MPSPEVQERLLLCLPSVPVSSWICTSCWVFLQDQKGRSRDSLYDVTVESSGVHACSYCWPHWWHALYCLAGTFLLDMLSLASRRPLNGVHVIFVLGGTMASERFACYIFVISFLRNMFLMRYETLEGNCQVCCIFCLTTFCKVLSYSEILNNKNICNGSKGYSMYFNT